jgi:hypothetical protein
MITHFSLWNSESANWASINISASTSSPYSANWGADFTK